MRLELLLAVASSPFRDMYDTQHCVHACSKGPRGGPSPGDRCALVGGKAIFQQTPWTVLPLLPLRRVASSPGRRNAEYGVTECHQSTSNPPSWGVRDECNAEPSKQANRADRSRPSRCPMLVLRDPRFRVALSQGYVECQRKSKRKAADDIKTSRTKVLPPPATQLPRSRGDD